VSCAAAGPWHVDCVEKRLHTLQAALGYYELGMADDALRELNELQGDGRVDTSALELRALVLQRLGKWREAAEAYAALAESPGASVDTYIACGCCFYEVGDYAACREALLRAPPAARDHGLWNFHLACYEALLENWDEARRLIRKSLVLEPRLRGMARRNENMRKLI
jgi:tetratricopeptide (TPR) repeat protein